MAHQTARFVYLGAAQRPLDWLVGGMQELAFPLVEQGQCFYEGSVEFVKHFISTDPDNCKLVSLDPLVAMLRDGDYRLTPKTFKPCRRVSRKIRMGEDAEGNDVWETRYFWEETDERPAEGQTGGGENRGEALKAIEARMTAIAGEEGWREFIKGYRAEIQKSSGAFTADQIAEIAARVREVEAAVQGPKP